MIRGPFAVLAVIVPLAVGGSAGAQCIFEITPGYQSESTESFRNDLIGMN